MKAIITTTYGGPEVLELRDISTPTPKENEVLIKITATSVTAASTMMRTGTPYFGRLFMGLSKPKNPIFGTDLAGVIVETGATVSKFKKGDMVIAETGINASTYAEYVVLSEDDVIIEQPMGFTPEEATGILDGGLTALSFFTDSTKIKQGQKVLINGASGSIGTAAVQLAKNFGAHVTAVCSKKNHSLMRSLGADFVIDYNSEDLTDLGTKYDLIFDTVGKLSFKECKKVLTENGLFLTPVLSMNALGQMIFSSFGKKKLKFAATGLRKPDLIKRDLKEVKRLMEAGKLKTVIDRTYKLEQIQEAHEYVGKGHKCGNVVISMNA